MKIHNKYKISDEEYEREFREYCKSRAYWHTQMADYYAKKISLILDKKEKE